MRKVDKPTITAGDSFTTCIKNIKNNDLKNRLAACTPLIINAELEFNSKISMSNIHKINSETVVNGNVKAKEFANIYTLRMINKKAPGE